MLQKRKTIFLDENHIGALLFGTKIFALRDVTKFNTVHDTAENVMKKNLSDDLLGLLQ
jgi:hypothetical protein